MEPTTESTPNARPDAGGPSRGPSREPARLRRERKTIAAMVGIYCRKKHGKRRGGAPCPQCDEILRYAFFRLDRCPFGAEKPTCARCPVHCYRPDMRERVRDVMRFAGPKMVFSHAILALRHVLDGLRECEKPGKKGAART